MTNDTVEKNKQIVRQLYERCINEGRLELLEGLISTEFVGPRGERGPAGYGETVAGLRRGFPDIEFYIEDLVAEGDRVTVRWKWSGTHSGQFRELAPTNRAVTDTGIAIYRLKDAKVAEAWLQTDRLGVLQQIGVVSMPASPPPQAQAPR